MSQDKYKTFVAQAERAVSDVSEPALKQIAFQKILDDLLAGTREPKDASSRTKPRAKQVVSFPPGPIGKEGPKQYIMELIDDGFFNEPKTTSSVRAELATRGRHLTRTLIAVALLRLCKRKVLRRAKVADSEEGNTYAYSMW